jgi:hypothetical protein
LASRPTFPSHQVHVVTSGLPCSDLVANASCLLFASLVSGSDAGEEAGDAPAFALQTAVASNGSKPRFVLMPRCFSGRACSFSRSFHYLRKKVQIFIYACGRCRLILQGEACSCSGGGVAAGPVVPSQPGFLESVVVGSPGRRSQERGRRHVREDQHGRRPYRAQGGPRGIRRIRRALRRRRQALPRPARRYVSQSMNGVVLRGYVPSLSNHRGNIVIAQPRGIRPRRVSAAATTRRTRRWCSAAPWTAAAASTRWCTRTRRATRSL